MQKRAICFLLSVLMLLGMVCMTAPGVSAASEWKASEDCIALIKAFEGFSKEPYYDHGQWSVGYGTACGEGEYPDGITEEEADGLLRQYVEQVEIKLNNFANKYGLPLAQHQFDALVSFTYNLGGGWMSDPSQLFTNAVITGASGNDFIFAITRWCSVTIDGTKYIEEGLVSRRLIEANLYLNGICQKEVPSNYKYLIFDDNIDECVNDVRIQGYDNTVTDSLRSNPSKPGYRFLGWYTAAQGGEWVSFVGPGTVTKTVYGHWQEGDGNGEGTAANYVRYCSEEIVRDAPREDGAEVGRLGINQPVTIVADYMDESGIKWGRLSTGGWISLANTSAQEIELADPIKVHVLGEDVNIRSGPGTDFSKLGTFAKGQELTLTAVQQSGQYKWGKSEQGWIRLDYTDYDQVTAGPGSDGAKVTATGTVTGTDKMNVRGGPGTNYPVVGSLKRGDQVKITLQQKVGNTTWGLTEVGWVSLYYIELTPVTEPETPEPADPAEVETTPMYRLYNPNSGEHFYTGSVEERGNLINAGWSYEGIAWNAPVSTGTPVYRVFNPNNGDHHYTMSMEEVENLKAAGWQYEGVAWNSAGPENVPQYRLYNPNADCGSHHYTSSVEERDYLVSLGWKYEGIGWYGLLR